MSAASLKTLLIVSCLVLVALGLQLIRSGRARPHRLPVQPVPVRPILPPPEMAVPPPGSVPSEAERIRVLEARLLAETRAREKAEAEAAALRIRGGQVEGNDSKR